MTNWYYVQGSERVGPVTEILLQRLFLDNVIDLETYVWKKGFQNWMRIKNVDELSLNLLNNENTLLTEERTETGLNQKDESEIFEKKQIEIVFDFNWNNLDEMDEIFYLKIGRDRVRYEGIDVFGPYSFKELKEALALNRINSHTLIFTPGMEAWQKIHDTPLCKDFNLGISSGIILNEAPLVLVHMEKTNRLVSIVKKASAKYLVLLAGKDFKKFEKQKIKLKFFVGSIDKMDFLEVEVIKYDSLEQTLDCRVISISDDSKKILLNHAG